MALERGKHTDLETALEKLIVHFDRASDSYEDQCHIYYGLSGNRQEEDNEELPPDEVRASRLSVLFQGMTLALNLALLEHRISVARVLNPELEGLSNREVSELIEKSIKSESIGQSKTPQHLHP